jgi:hypothetical protein
MIKFFSQVLFICAICILTVGCPSAETPTSNTTITDPTLPAETGRGGKAESFLPPQDG